MRGTAAQCEACRVEGEVWGSGLWLFAPCAHADAAPGARALAQHGTWCFAPAAAPGAERGGALGADLVLSALIKCMNSKVEYLVGGLCVCTSTETGIRNG